MKRVLALTLVVFLAMPGVAAADDELEGEAELHSINASGVTGEFEFVDNGSTVTIEGEAEGLTPGVLYASLIYDNASVATGPLACEPIIFDPTHPDFILDRMFVGFWTVDEDGEGTLTATNFSEEPGFPAVYVPLDKFHTISIRAIVSPHFGFGPEAVVACGVEEADD